MDLRTLTKEQLAASLRELQEHPSEANAEAIGRLQNVVQEIEVHRVELEMQNRALQETRHELEQSLSRYADLYENLPIGYIIVRPDGEIACANPAAVELLQVPRQQLIGRFFGTFLDPYDAGRFAAHLESCGQTGRPAQLELTLRLRDGATPTVQLSSRPATMSATEGKQVHVAITDISELKAAQRVLEEINREQEAFSYSISHDLRAPLVTISNYARIVLNDHKDDIDEESRGMLQRIESAAVRMEETLKNLLEYSTLARDEVVLQAVNVSEIIRDLLIEHRGIIQQSGAQISVEPSLPMVRGSRVILNQVLANLLTNALKYTPAGQAPRVHISGEVGERTVVLRVADEGIGIDPKFHERIFRIFERLHGYTRYPGSGIGLAIARRAVERMRGRIWVSSEPGKGSCFCIELPRA